MPTNNYITVVEKTLRVLEAFRGESEVRLSDLVTRTGMVKSSVYRILFTLVRLGYVSKTPGGRYSISSRFSLFRGEQRATFNLRRLAAPFMARLQAMFQETVNLGVLDGSEVLYIHVLESSYAFRLATHAGMRSPLHSTALGKCLLCRLPHSEVDVLLKNHRLPPRTPKTICDRAAFYRELQRVRLRGYAIDNQEDAEGTRAVAAPIVDPDGYVCGAIGISGPAVRLKPAHDEAIAMALMQACEQISTLLGYTASSSTKWAGGVS